MFSSCVDSQIKEYCRKREVVHQFEMLKREKYRGRHKQPAIMKSRTNLQMRDTRVIHMDIILQNLNPRIFLPMERDPCQWFKNEKL